MKTTGFYKLSERYLKLIESLNGTYRDKKERPVYCCLQDDRNPEIFWAIPTSDIAHRTPKQMQRIQEYCNLPQRDIRSCYYHIGHTNRPAIFKISNALPVTSEYIDSEYTSKGQHLILQDKVLIEELSKKLKRILLTESKRPNLFEQHITDIYNYLCKEIQKEH